MRKKRLYQLLLFLLNQTDYISAKKIANYLNVSSRTIYNDINSQEFKYLLKGAYIDKRPKVGIKLIADKQQKNYLRSQMENTSLYSLQRYNSYNDLTNILLVMFTSKNYTTINKLSKQLYMSQKTLRIAIDNTNNWLESYGIKIQSRKNCGLFISGKEKDIRQVFKDVCLNLQNSDSNFQNHHNNRLNKDFKDNLNQIFTSEVVDKIVDIVNTSEVNLNENYTDYDYVNIVIKLCIVVLRNKLGKKVESDQQFNNDIREKLVAELIRLQLESTFNLKLSNDELNEITLFILSTRKQNSILSSYDKNMINIIEKFIHLLSESLNVNLNNDDELKINLIRHLNPAIRRIRYGIKIENPLLNQIKYEYPNVYISVMTAIEEIEKNENIVFDANELGFICLHIVAGINRSTKKRYISAILICDGGLTISNFLKSKIEKQFNEISIVKTIPSNNFNKNLLDQYDLVLNSTKTSLLFSDNIILINFLLDFNSQEAIRSWIIKNQYRKIIHNDKKIRKNMLFFKDNLSNKEELLKKYCKFLEIEGYVDSKFYQSVIKREQMASTSVGRGIAVPHGSSEYINNSVITIILLKNPIQWDQQIVNLVFLLAINHHKTKNYQYFYEKLFNIISDNDLINKIKKSFDPKEIEELIFKNNPYKVI
ncbi:BglG family transcription antiterminator [Garciella nitratireducens]|uniref:BglG family transcription antiterminator n=1 Tax=Garciella nitratireducens TaxID=218205 RepID=UPI001BD6CB02|nr:PTS sugar transporter subunit IIA [Garciella nitratireducens]